jgi:hypothetical protein
MQTKYQTSPIPSRSPSSLSNNLRGGSPLPVPVAYRFVIERYEFINTILQIADCSMSCVVTVVRCKEETCGKHKERMICKIVLKSVHGYCDFHYFVLWHVAWFVKWGGDTFFLHRLHVDVEENYHTDILLWYIYSVILIFHFFVFIF